MESAPLHSSNLQKCNSRFRKNITRKEAKDKAVQEYGFIDWASLVDLGHEHKISKICDLAMEIYLTENNKPAPERQ